MWKKSLKTSVLRNPKSPQSPENKAFLTKKKEPISQFLSQRYKDSNLENDGVRVRCLTVWR